MISSKNVIMVRGLLRSKPTKMAQALMSTKPQEDGEKSSGKNEHLLFFTNLWVLAGQAGYGSTRLNSYFRGYGAEWSKTFFLKGNPV